MKIEDSLGNVAIMALEMEPFAKLGPNATVSEAIYEMRRKDLGHVLPVEDGEYRCEKLWERCTKEVSTRCP